jgi:hypothetical protein
MTFRQGDILTVRLLKAIPTDGLERIGIEGDSVVLAHGEATGHRHRFRGKRTEMVAPWPEGAPLSERVAHARALLAGLKEIPSGAKLVGILNVRSRDDLVHEEHDTIPHEEGQYAVIRQRTYTPARIRVVED